MKNILGFHTLLYLLPLLRFASGTLPAAFFLAGDSTTASASIGHLTGGWGDGFLNFTLQEPAFGINFGRGGATTVSFRTGGNWADVIAEVENHTATNNVFVTIQFGHNDQAPSSNISLEDYSTNLGNFVKDVRMAGGIPMMVTPLTRRNFKGDPPRINQTLAAYRDATLAVAEELSARYIDLNKASEDYCNAIGPNNSHLLALEDKPDDRTHLNEHGSIVFGRLVSDLMVAKYDDIKEWTKPNETLSREIAEGVPDP